MSMIYNRLKSALHTVPDWWWWSIGLGILWLAAIELDVPITQWFLARRNTPLWLAFRTTVWPLGSGGLYGAALLLLLLGFWLLKYRPGVDACKWLIISLIIATAVSYAGKRALRRPRPENIAKQRPEFAEQWASTEWHSFPSGDMLAATTVVWVLWVILGRRREFRWLAVIPAIVALQRLSAARHYPSDLVASLLFAMWIRIGVERWMKRREGNNDSA